MLTQAVKAKFRCIKELAIRKARQWTRELMASPCYPGAIKNRFSQTLEGIPELTLQEKTQIWELIVQFLYPKNAEESVTQIS